MFKEGNAKTLTEYVSLANDDKDDIKIAVFGTNCFEDIMGASELTFGEAAWDVFAIDDSKIGDSEFFAEHVANMAKYVIPNFDSKTLKWIIGSPSKKD